MKELQILRNKAAVDIRQTTSLLINQCFNSPEIDEYMEERRNCHRCLYTYKCMNGQLAHSLDIVRKSDMHAYNTRNKDATKLPKIKNNWGKHRSRYHCVKDFNELERTIRKSASLPVFRKCLFSTFCN